MITRRDYFAGLAMREYLRAAVPYRIVETPERGRTMEPDPAALRGHLAGVARMSYEVADAMEAARGPAGTIPLPSLTGDS